MLKTDCFMLHQQSPLRKRLIHLEIGPSSDSREGKKNLVYLRETLSACWLRISHLEKQNSPLQAKVSMSRNDRMGD